MERSVRLRNLQELKAELEKAIDKTASAGRICSMVGDTAGLEQSKKAIADMEKRLAAVGVLEQEIVEPKLEPEEKPEEKPEQEG